MNAVKRAPVKESSRPEEMDSNALREQLDAEAREKWRTTANDPTVPEADRRAATFFAGDLDSETDEQARELADGFGSIVPNREEVSDRV